MTAPAKTTSKPATRAAKPATTSVTPISFKPQTTAQRVAALNAQARALAKEDVTAFAAEVAALSKRAAEIAEMGDAVPVGVRERASKMVMSLEGDAGHIISVLNKVP
ncbi:hypothetical protein BAJUN_00390 [Bajunvirus bajun]|uniref:Uncharacterized protein n=1 Tax=Brevundimonas phage vB_BgoS-Bajun TaxID=2948594 RepID=A0A9E7N793_9CAUD|nr:hypothetical protein BAJUN_00390 [Brevundimonas phage vB_BgoS-Bajun]